MNARPFVTNLALLVAIVMVTTTTVQGQDSSIETLLKKYPMLKIYMKKVERPESQPKDEQLSADDPGSQVKSPPDSELATEAPADPSAEHGIPVLTVDAPQPDDGICLFEQPPIGSGGYTKQQQKQKPGGDSSVSKPGPDTAEQPPVIEFPPPKDGKCEKDGSRVTTKPWYADDSTAAPSRDQLAKAREIMEQNVHQLQAAINEVQNALPNLSGADRERAQSFLSGMQEQLNDWQLALRSLN